jgi:hypothetical protein
MSEQETTAKETEALERGWRVARGGCASDQPSRPPLVGFGRRDINQRQRLRLTCVRSARLSTVYFRTTNA